MYTVVGDIWPHKSAGYDVTSYFQSAFIEVRKTAENAASDGFGSNFSGAAFCLPHQLVGFLLGKTPFWRFTLLMWGLSAGVVVRHKVRQSCVSRTV